MTRNLIISVDYEIFGGGSGDVRQHITEPAERMARACEKYNAPLTVFFEVEEFLSFERHRAELVAMLGYDPADLIRNQIIDFARRGHDIQLHLHPEWFGARFEAGRWVLNENKPAVDSLFSTQEETTEYIRSRKEVIDRMLETAGARQRVQVYRAGAFYAQPGQKLLAALAASGILIDSSVVKGLVDSERPNGFDYQGAPCRKGPWRVKDDVAREDASGAVWEFPIYSVMGRRWQQVTLSRMRAKLSKNVPNVQQIRQFQQLGFSCNPVRLAKFLCAPVPIKLDYHNLSPRRLVDLICSAPRIGNDLPDVLVMIGHTKEHIDDLAFFAFLGSGQPEART